MDRIIGHSTLRDAGHNHVGVARASISNYNPIFIKSDVVAFRILAHSF